MAPSDETFRGVSPYLSHGSLIPTDGANKGRRRLLQGTLRPCPVREKRLAPSMHLTKLITSAAAASPRQREDLQMLYSNRLHMPKEQPVSSGDRHAVVVGGSIGGMLAARVLADHFDRVTVIERDQLPDGQREPAGRAAGPPSPFLLQAGADGGRGAVPGGHRRPPGGGQPSSRSGAGLPHPLSLGVVAPRGDRPRVLYLHPAAAGGDDPPPSDGRIPGSAPARASRSPVW